MFGFIERFASVLVAAGMPPMPARVFVALMVTDSGRLTAAELAEMLRISPAAVSGRGALPDRARPGAQGTGAGLAAGLLPDARRRVARHDPAAQQVITRWTTLLREGVDVVGPDTPAGARLAEHAAFFDFVAKELPAVMTRWDAYRAGGAAGPG